MWFWQKMRRVVVLYCSRFVRKRLNQHSGATVAPIAAGGSGRAEGAVTLIAESDEEQVNKAYIF